MRGDTQRLQERLRREKPKTKEGKRKEPHGGRLKNGKGQEREKQQRIQEGGTKRKRTKAEGTTPKERTEAKDEGRERAPDTEKDKTQGTTNKNWRNNRRRRWRGQQKHKELIQRATPSLRENLDPNESQTEGKGPASTQTEEGVAQRKYGQLRKREWCTEERRQRVDTKHP